MVHSLDQRIRPHRRGHYECSSTNSQPSAAKSSREEDPTDGLLRYVIGHDLLVCSLLSRFPTHLTISSIVGIYGSFETRTVETQQLFYKETAWIMMNDIEVFAYALGASFPGTPTLPSSFPTSN